MGTEKPLKAWRPGASSTAHMPPWRGKGDRFSTFSEQVKWERATKPKIFAPSEEPPLGRLLSVLKPDDAHDKPNSLRSESVVTDCRTVASFNWLDAAGPAIVIPGGLTIPESCHFFSPGPRLDPCQQTPRQAAAVDAVAQASTAET